MTDVSFTDYAWIRDAGELFEEGFSLTVIAHATIDNVLAGLSEPTSSTQGGYNDISVRRIYGQVVLVGRPVTAPSRDLDEPRFPGQLRNRLYGLLRWFEPRTALIE